MRNRLDAMKMIARLAGAVALALFAVPASAQEDCDDWNTSSFFRSATAESVAACLEAGADVNARTDSTFDDFSFSGVFGRNTPLHFATIYSWDGMVTVLLAAGAEVDARDLQGETPLHWAAGRNRNPAVVAELVEAGADLNARDGDGNTPLHASRRNTNPAVPLLLLELGADSILVNDSGWVANPMDCSHWNTDVFARVATAEATAACLEAGADVSARDEDQHTPLLLATLHGGVRTGGGPGSEITAVVTVLLEAGADVNARGNVRNTALHHAAAGKYLETARGRYDHVETPAIVAALLAAGADIHAQDLNGHRPLHRAASAEGLETVAMLLEAGADINARDPEGDTPLLMAAERGFRDPEIIETLVEAGADVNDRNEQGETVLERALRYPTDRLTHVVRRLLDLGADANEPGLLAPPLHHAACEGDDPELIAVLLDAGADVNAFSRGGQTPLHRLVSEAQVPSQLPFPNYAEPDDYPIARVIAAFVEAGADVNAVDRGGSTPLHYAVGRIYNRTALSARALVDAGADVNARDSRGGTPLHRAAGPVGPLTDLLVSLLVEAGADIHATDDGGRTALHHALRSDNPAIAARLIELGSDVAARDDSGHLANPLDCARFNTATFFHLAPTETVAGCIEAGADVNAGSVYRRDGSQLPGLTPLHFASVWARDPAIVSLLVQAGAEVNARDDSGGSPLHAAAGSTSEPAMIVALAEAGAELNVWRPGVHSPYGWSPLHLAVDRNRNPVVTAALLEAGADVHARQEDGPTSLHDAATAEVVALLLEAGADIEARATYWGWRQPNGRDMTPLHVAAKRGNAAVFMALLDAGADPAALDIEGKTPLDHAREQKALQELEVVKRSAR